MDCKVEAAALRKAGIGTDTVVLTSAGGGWHHQQGPHSPLPPPSAAQEGEPGGLLWEEDFSVDDLLDLGDAGEEQHGAEGEEFLRVGEAEEGEGGEEGEESGGWCNSISSSSAATTTTSALSFQTVAPPPSSSDPIIVPAGDVEDLEWVSRFVDDSYSEFAAAAAAPPFANLHAPAPPASAAAVKTGAPKASSTSSGTPLKRSWHSCSFSTATVAVPAKARSQRPRTGGRGWSLGRASFLCEPSSSSCSSVSSSSSCSAFSSVTSSLGELGRGNAGRLLHCFSGAPPLGHCPPQALKKKKGRKPKVVPAAAINGGVPEQEARRRCSHCGVDKTPQWRAGPMGAKTLCNACGVRFKSGRLLPEYRPAGSPTFLSHVHSNSHRRVLELRRSKQLVPSASAAASCWPSPPPQPAAPTRPYGVV